MTKKSEVCIVTWYGTANYGSSLQSYALSAVLRQMGYDVSFLGSFSVKPFFLRHPMLAYARIVNKINDKKRRAFFNPVPYKISEERKKRLAEFKNSTYKTKRYSNSAEWKRDIKNNIIFASGSDILWNPALGYPAMRFLDFAYYAKLGRFSYASSVGALELPKKYCKAYKRYIGSMQAVGVREASVKKMLEPIVGREVTQVVDPTLLLTKDDWTAFSEKARISVPVSKDGYILCYFVMNDPRYWEYVKLIAQSCNKQIIVLPMHSIDEQQPYDIITDGTPPEFVKLIKDADYICTDSFHACVISSVFHKDFYLLRRSRKAENAKYDDFLGRYGLSDRSINDESRFEIKPETDFSTFDRMIVSDREHAAEFLKTALKKCGNNN